jgi:hypothetical protein
MGCGAETTMNRSLVAMVAAIAFALSAYSETKEGSCQLKPGKPSDENVFKVQVGDKVKGTAKFFTDDFFGKKIISANVELVNTGTTTMYCQYYVAFFDKDGNLIGCAGQGTSEKNGLAAGKSTQLGSCLIPLPEGVHEKAVQYKIAFYEGDKPIGK